MKKSMTQKIVDSQDEVFTNKDKWVDFVKDIDDDFLDKMNGFWGDSRDEVLLKEQRNRKLQKINKKGEL